jgi:tRNA threonylcarbamoyladenosine biosynthesis protein TsaB
VITLAFDTATDVATVAVVRDGVALDERRSRASRILVEIDAALATAGVSREDVERLAVGVGPGSYTGLRMGLVTARTLAFTLGIPAGVVSTLAALAAGTRGAVPVLDARRGQVFSLVDAQPVVLAPEDLSAAPGTSHVGDGAVRYRALIEARGGHVPPDDADAHVPWARHHATLATDFGAADTLEPLYLRIPDAEIALREGRLRT